MAFVRHLPEIRQRFIDLFHLLMMVQHKGLFKRVILFRNLLRQCLRQIVHNLLIQQVLLNLSVLFLRKFYFHLFETVLQRD